MRFFDMKNRSFGGSTNFAAVLTIGGSLLLSACSSVPDAANPVKWYNSASDWVSGSAGEDQQTASQPASGAEVTGEQQANAGDPLPTAAPSGDPNQLREGLVADRANASYTDEGGAVQPIESRPVAPVEQPTSPSASAPRSQQLAETPPTESRPPPARQEIPGAPRTAQAQATPQMAQASDGGYDTIIITSDGVSTQSGTAPIPQVPQAPMRSPDAMPSSGYQAPNMQAPSGIQGQLMRPDAPSLQARPISAIDPNAQGATYHVATINFPMGTDVLTARAMETLRMVADAHRQKPGMIRVVGHASSRTRDMSVDRHETVNYELSVGRASNTAAALIQLGVPENMITAEAASDTQPQFFEFMPAGEAGNRRSEVYISY